jgi:hypothetical protein
MGSSMSQVIFDDLSGATILEVNSKTHGTFIAWIDSEDANKVASYQWYVQISDSRVYFQAKVRKPDGKRATLKLHRLLKVCPDGLGVDHEKHEYLDLRKNELRCVNNQQNNMNQRKQTCPTSSRYKGVSWFKQTSKWQAYIQNNGKKIHLGTFTGTPEGELEAARAYDAKAIELFGEFSHLNFPLEVAA